jgi:pyruvate dehydrogenase E1 component beta subunit
MREITYAAAIGEALREEMERDENVFVIGEDIGSVREADDLFAAFRERRAWQTPISEAGFTGLAVGAAASGLRPVVEIMYCDFLGVCLDQVCNQAAKLSLMSGGAYKVPMVIKTPAGCGTREGGHHSQSLEAWLIHTPGLKVVMPSTPYDAKGLMKSAIRDDYTVPLGQGVVRSEGTDITVVAWSYAAVKAQEAAKRLEGEVSVEVVDPRSLVPFDLATVLASVRKTGRLLVVQEAAERAGAGAEIVRLVVEADMAALKTAPRVLGSRNIPMPYSPPLEDAVIPQVHDITRTIREMVG